MWDFVDLMYNLWNYKCANDCCIFLEGQNHFNSKALQKNPYNHYCFKRKYKYLDMWKNM